MRCLHSFRGLFIVTITLIVVLRITTLSAFTTPNSQKTGMSSTGNIVIIWNVYDDTYTNNYIRCNTWNGSVWSGNTTLSADPGVSFKPVLAINSDGNGAALWSTLESNGTYSLQGKIFYNGVWDSTATQLSEADETVIDYHLQVNDNGDLSATWSTYLINDSETEIYVLHSTNLSTGWNTSTGISIVSD